VKSGKISPKIAGNGRNSEMKRWLYSNWFEGLFAGAWITGSSLYWLPIKSKLQFQYFLGLVGGLDFPWSLASITVVYVMGLSTLIWVGLVIYLAFTKRLDVRSASIGFAIVAAGVMASSLPRVLLANFSVPVYIRYGLDWFLPFLALWWSISHTQRSQW
jgi:hypothetical protein